MLKTFLAFFKHLSKKMLVFVAAVWSLSSFFISSAWAAPLPPSQLPTTAPPGIFGRIAAPPGVDKYQNQVGANQIGIIVFLSNMIKLVTIVAGIWTMFNFISAGWIYLNAAGDSSANEKAAQQMTNSVIGLAIIAFSYAIAGLIGFLIFGDAQFILNPDLTTINELSAP